MNSDVTVLLTGSQGQLGRHLSSLLRGKVCLVECDKNTLDITKLSDVEELIKRIEPDIVINAAAYTTVDKAENEPELADEVNHIGPQNLARAISATNALLVHVSTDYVFDGQSDKPYKETDITNPKGVYGLTKLRGENAVKTQCSNYIILRTSWVFSEYGSNFVKTMLRLGRERNTISVVNDQFGAPTYAGDIANAILVLCSSYLANSSKMSETLHFSGYPYTNWYEFAQNIFTEADGKGLLSHPVIINQICTSEYPTLACRPANSKLDCSSIKQKYNIEPSNWKQALTKILKNMDVK
ncbi:dTDP-4-dehydrorhamnose reductase [Citrobacter cronae]|uniref:dTDP-4-dehydrorhamnose reductase n=1 Tax=Citrobacter freundii complex TaxID=1344959 RepID=UPI003339E0FC